MPGWHSPAIYARRWPQDKRGGDWHAKTEAPGRVTTKAGLIPGHRGLKQQTKAEGMARGKGGYGCNS